MLLVNGCKTLVKILVKIFTVVIFYFERFTELTIPFCLYRDMRNIMTVMTNRVTRRMEKKSPKFWKK
jgi:hypothetical protein